MTRDESISWCAGVFDGVGQVKYYRSYPHEKTKIVTSVLYANVPMKEMDLEVLESFKSIMGFGVINGPYNGVKFVLRFGVKDTIRLYEILKPYLRSNRILEFQRAISAHQRHSPIATPDDLIRLEGRVKRDEPFHIREENIRTPQERIQNGLHAHHGVTGNRINRRGGSNTNIGRNRRSNGGT